MRGQGRSSDYACQFRIGSGVDIIFGIYRPEIERTIPAEYTIGPENMCGLAYASTVGGYCTVTPESACSGGGEWAGPQMFVMERPQLVQWVASSVRRLALYPDNRRVLVFKATTSGSTASVFAGVNGNTGAAEEFDADPASGSSHMHNVFKVRGRDGYVYWYFGEDPTSVTVGSYTGVAPHLRGQLWKMAYDTGGSESTWPTTYVGEDAPGTTNWDQLSNAYRGFTLCPGTGTPTDLLPRVKTMYDSAGRRFSYAYDSSGRVTYITKAKYNGTTWDTVSEAAYVYGSSSPNALELIQTKQRLSDTSVSLCKYQYFRYDADGKMLLKMTAEGVRQAAYGKYLPSASTQLDFELTSDVKAYLDDQYANHYSDLKPYADALVEYYTSGVNSGKVWKLTSNGMCGCSGGPSGQFIYSYETPSDYSAGSNGVNTTDGTYDCAGAWYSSGQSKSAGRTIIQRPDGTFMVVYFDDTAQVLASVDCSATPSTTSSAQTYWATVYERDSDTRIKKGYSPEAVTGYDHATGKFTVYSGTTPIGTITEYAYVSTSTDSYLTGPLVEKVVINQGSGSGWATVSKTEYVSSSTAYQDVGTSNTARIAKPLVSASWIYKTEVTSGSGTSGTDYDKTTYAYTYWSSSGAAAPWAIKSMTTTNPTVTTGENGSGSATTTLAYVDQSTGKTVFTQSATGRIDFYKYASDSGQLTDKVEDVDASVTDASSAASAFSLSLPSTSSMYFRLRTTYGYDSQSRLTSVTFPSSRKTYIYYTRIADHQAVRLSGPLMISSGGTDTYTGPVTYSITNQLGKPTGTGILTLGCSTCPNTSNTIAGWISTSGSTAIAAVGGDATLARFSGSEYDFSGTRLTTSRLYKSWSGSPASEDTSYLYDGMGRVIAIKDAPGTIRRSTFDARGRVTEQAVGTNDYSASGQQFSSSGADDMTTTQKFTYATSASSGTYLLGTNRLLSQQSDVDGNWATTGDIRTTTYVYDHRDRVVLTQAPVSPHTLVKYDFQSRVVASALYSSTAAIIVGTTDPAGSATSDKANRLAAFENYFDALGRSRKQADHKVAQSDGSFSTTNDLETLRWFDEDGVIIKSTGPDGLMKYKHDRMLRQTRVYTLAKIDDTDYDAVVALGRGLSNDIVLEETQTAYDSSTGDVLFSATFSRHHDQGITVTGPLDSDADGDEFKITASDLKQSSVIIARAQIAAYWYDDLDRLKESVILGTYGLNEVSGPTAFDRIGDFLVSSEDTPPARSDTSLRTTTAYNKEGTVDIITDARGIVTKTEYDSAGLRITTISNYTGASPPLTTADRDTDAYVRYVYSNGLMTKMWVDLDGDGTEDSDDQVTQYVYGSPKGTVGSGSPPASAIATKHLLREAIYPPQTGVQSAADRTVATAYNALSEVVWTRDQNGTVLTSAFDLSGRLTDRVVVTLGTSGSATVDGTVVRIGTSYTDRGQIETVVQYDSGNTPLNGIKYTYDDWGNVTKLEQDRDSAVGGSGAAALAVEWGYARQTPTNGRPRVQRSSVTLSGSFTTTNLYPSASIDELVGRVSALDLPDESVEAQYQYLGAGMVVGTTLTGPSRSSDLFDSSGQYTYHPSAHPDAGLDRFNRMAVNRWTVTGTSTNIYRIDLAYDRDSNITRILDAVEKIAGTRVYDTGYTIDGLNRVTGADRGTWSGTAIGGSTRNTEAWALTQTGNWATDTIDTDGTTGFEFSDSRTHNNVNEILTRSSPSATASYDKAGQMLDDGSNWKYRYDAFGRVVEVKSWSTGTVISEYVYDGLGERIGWHYDVNASGGGPNSSDPWYWFMHDDRWRIVATYRVSGGTGSGSASFRHSSATTDSSPKERFIYHNAGQDGLGGSSYVDSLVVIRRDLDSSWGAAADGSLEAWHYPVANWRNDTVGVESQFGGSLAGYRYTAYGKRTATLTADFDGDGFVDPSFDYDAFIACYEESDCPEGASADWNHDGMVDFVDYYAFLAAFDGDVGKGGTLRHLYAGYECDPTLDKSEGSFAGSSVNSVYSVRNRTYVTDCGRWIKRDPQEYVDGVNLDEYVKSSPIIASDPDGLACTVWTSCSLKPFPGPIPVTKSFFGRLKCVMCTYRCQETRREDSLHTGCGCDDDEIGQKVSKLKNVKQVVYVKYLQVCSWTATPTCASSLNDKRIFFETSSKNKDRNCSASMCIADCNQEVAQWKVGCQALKGVLKTACNTAADAFGVGCRDTCSAWCQKP